LRRADEDGWWDTGGRGAGAGRLGRRIVAAVLVVAALGTFVPSRGDARPTNPATPASPGQEDPSGGSGYSDSAIVDIPVEVAEGAPADVIGTLEEIEVNVSRQLTDLQTADSAVDAAQAELDEADAVVAETVSHIDGLVAESDDVVTGAYVNPPRDAIFDTLSAESANEAAVKQALLSMQAEEDAATLAELEDARQELEVERIEQADVAAAAEQKRTEKEAQRADLEAATSQQTDFVLAVSDRLGAQLAEAEAVRSIDPAMAAALEEDQATLAAKLREIAEAEAFQEAVEFLQAETARLQAEEEARRAEEERLAAEAAAAEAARERATAGPASGELATATCPAGAGTITVDSGISAALQDLLNDAAAAGVNMCGGGWRSPDAQIQLRRQNCGTTEYLIYEAPSSACNPPTARPGTSLHERGLAIDFNCNGGGVIPHHDSPCFVWLNANAATYGFYNLPSEPWHWSTTGG
jgi:hypothetical protein